MQAPLDTDRIFSVNEANFEGLAVEIFNRQYLANKIYRSFCDGVRKTPANVKSLAEIPFLPIEVFKTHEVYAAAKAPEIIFTSSGTSGMITSRHLVADLHLYEQSFLKAFSLFYGDIKEFTVLALLPSYLARSGSSLVYMADKLIRASENKESSFYLNNYTELWGVLKRLRDKKVLLLGVTYALLDLAEQFPQNLSNTIIMETGGMKGQRREMIREELHARLCMAFKTDHIHSEYGMTELLSQAYSNGNGIFKSPPWMKIMIREMNDPFSFTADGKTGGVNIIDLANLNSCSFIASSDLGKLHSDGSFEILGRFDYSDTRGCNLLVQ